MAYGVPCPECGAPARVTRQLLLDSTDGPIEHLKTGLRERALAHPPDRDGQAGAAGRPGSVAISFTLDGAPLDTTRTPIEPFHDPQAFALERAWYFQEGRIMSPDDLSVGQAEVRALGIARG